MEDGKGGEQDQKIKDQFFAEMNNDLFGGDEGGEEGGEDEMEEMLDQMNKSLEGNEDSEEDEK